MQILKLKNLSFLLIICASALVVFSCGDDDDDDPTDPTVCETEGLTYDNWAKEYINGSCATSGCHNADFLANSVPFTMHNYEAAKASIDAGRILGAMKREAGFSPMPKNEEKASDCDISKMEAWIAGGAPE
ncbi:MAG: hypothetical protein ACI86M_003629 [Saprospiraceae bacterium]|jgi:hypothetical protein